MDMTEIDLILADDLSVGDTFKDATGDLITIVRVETDGDLIMAYGEDDDEFPYTFAWDTQVHLYGYPVITL